MRGFALQPGPAPAVSGGNSPGFLQKVLTHCTAGEHDGGEARPDRELAVGEVRGEPVVAFE